jgi:hypothetical protein
LSGGGFNDGRFAHARGIEVNVRTLFNCFSFDIQVKNLNDVADEIWELSDD